MLDRKTTILFAFLHLTVFTVVAQSNTSAIAHIGLPDNAVALSSGTKPLTSAAYQSALDSSATAPVSRAAAALSFTYYRQATSVLLHLKKSHNQVTLQVTNTIGNTVQLLSEENLVGGFYELPVLNQWLLSGVYTVRIVINEQVSTFQTVR